MKKDKRDEEFKKTQSTSSPGALGEDVNRKQSKKPLEKSDNKTSREAGLNEERSIGNGGAFEGLENTGDS